MCIPVQISLVMSRYHIPSDITTQWRLKRDQVIVLFSVRFFLKHCTPHFVKESKRKFRSEIGFRKEAKMEYCGARGEINSYHWTRCRDICICPVCSSGSFCRYRGTDYVKQKKQYNQTIKLPRELYCLVPLFVLWWRYLQKDPLVLLLLKEISSTSSNTTINTTRFKVLVKRKISLAKNSGNC